MRAGEPLASPRAVLRLAHFGRGTPGSKRAIKNKGLNEVLDQAREENPLREPPPPLDIPSHAAGSSPNPK